MRAAFWRELDVVGLALDVLLVASTAAVFLSAEKVIWFHMAFLLMVVLAFRSTPNQLLARAVPSGLAVVVALVIAYTADQLPADELFELPIMFAMIVGVSATATRRARATEELARSNETIDRLHAESRRELEDQLILGQRLQVSNRVNVAVVHDINNALTRMRVAAEALDLHAGDHDLVARTADEIIGYVDETALIAKELLTAARMTNTLEPERHEDVIDTLETMAPLLRRLCRPDTALVIDCTGLQSRPCALPQLRIRQVLSSLVANAVDAIGYAPGTIRIDAHTESSDGGDQFVVDVIDSGIGMNDSTLRRVFEPYFTTKGDNGGTGLGLYAVRELLQSAGGSITVSSVLGEGSTVRLRIPHDVPEAPSAARAGRMRALHILMAEDDVTCREPLAAALNAAGHRVTTAPDGAHAIDLLRIHDDIDVVVSDIAMPHVDGLQLADHIDTHHRELPIILMTSGPIAAPAGPVGREWRVLPKPVSVADLLAELQFALGSRQRIQETGSNR